MEYVVAAVILLVVLVIGAVGLMVPRLRRRPVRGFARREYSRYSPDVSFRIMWASTAERSNERATCIESSMSSHIDEQ